MQLVKCAFSVLAAGLLVSSCNQVDFKKTKGGMPYKLFSKDGGTKALPGNFLKINFMVKLNDSVLNTTYDKSPVIFPLQPGSQPYDVSEVFPLLKEGDSLYAVQMVDTFMARGQQLPPQFKKGDKIVTTIKVLKVFKTAQEAQADEEKEMLSRLKNEDASVQQYLSKNNVQAQKTGRGTYVQITQPGTGPRVDSGKFVSLMYTGTSFSGKTFDSNMDPKFGHTDPLTVQIGAGGSIPGFEEGLRALSQGARARMYIPSSLAYGGNPPSPDIKPFEHLMFDVQILSVSSTPPPPPAGAQAPPQAHNLDSGDHTGHNH
ncbi:MAG TPA: FKBP-type peptidyl-prolyl cis-trans isomerase [Chitinophagaceae bacterium]|nr:FKBP-type peptidyl-prolyl cis-trans isomerase [Chitinophagaceae bacterium]